VITGISSFIARLGLARAIAAANAGSPSLPYKITFVATYRCWTPCEAYPTILGNLAGAIRAGSPAPAADQHEREPLPSRLPGREVP
jgi:hypothetical protein